MRSCNCYTCQNYNRAYLRHLFMAREMSDRLMSPEIFVNEFIRPFMAVSMRELSRFAPPMKKKDDPVPRDGTGLVNGFYFHIGVIAQGVARTSGGTSCTVSGLNGFHPCLAGISFCDDALFGGHVSILFELNPDKPEITFKQLEF